MPNRGATFCSLDSGIFVLIKLIATGKFIKLHFTITAFLNNLMLSICSRLTLQFNLVFIVRPAMIAFFITLLTHMSLVYFNDLTEASENEYWSVVIVCGLHI